MQFDDILRLIGEMGPYQRVLILLIALSMIPEAFNSMIAVFLSAKMDHWCKADEWYSSGENCSSLVESDTFAYHNCTSEYRASFIPYTLVDGERVYSQCEMYSESSAGNYTIQFINSTTNCNDGWYYDTSRYRTTIVNDFDLVCSQSFLAGISQTVFYIGYLFGSWASGSLSDIIGRYYTFFVSIIVNFICGIILSFSPSFVFFCIFRFLVGVSNISLYITGFVIVTEIVGPSKRVYAGVAIPIGFGVGYMILALLAYCIRDWRTLQRTISCALLPCLLLIPILPESSRWLMAHKKVEKSKKILRTIAKYNKTLHLLPDDLDLTNKDATTQVDDKIYTFIDIIRSPRLRIAALTLFCLWFVNALVYFGLSLNTAKLGSDPYITFFLSGAVEVPASLLCVPFIQSPLGRRLTIFGFMITGGSSCLLTLVLPLGALRTTAAMIGKFCITASYSSLYIFSAEVFPTIVRSIGVGLGSTFGRFGSILASILLIIGDVWEPLPLLTFGTVAILGGCVVLTLPETRGRSLPGTLEEGEAFLRNARRVPIKDMDDNDDDAKDDIERLSPCSDEGYRKLQV